MACSTCGGGFAGRTGVSNYYNTRIARQTDPTDCDITKDMLLAWQQILLCLKENLSYESLDLSLFQVNQLLGIIQSGINYPDNYCFYKPQLFNFQNVLLPKIVTNVPECIQ